MNGPNVPVHAKSRWNIERKREFEKARTDRIRKCFGISFFVGLIFLTFVIVFAYDTEFYIPLLILGTIGIDILTFIIVWENPNTVLNSLNIFP